MNDDQSYSRKRRRRALARPWTIGQPWAYALATALTLATLLVRLALGFRAGDPPLLILYTFPIMLSAYVGGLRPGLLATSLAALLANYVLLPPMFSFSLATELNAIQSFSLLAAGTLISVLSNELHRARRRAEAQRRLQAITLASIGDAVVTTDAQGQITFLNAEAEHLTGWPLAEAIGQPLAAVFRIVNEDTRAPVEDPAAKVLRSGAIVGLANHTVLIARDGRETPIDDSGAPIRQDNGAVEGVVLVFRDVTEHKQAEAALQERERKLSTLFEILPVGISILDAERKVAFVNPALETILELSEANLYGRTYRKRAYLNAAGDPMPPGEFASARALAENTAIHNVETGIVKEDRSEIWTSVSAVPVDFPDWKVVIVTSDITERKRAEQALQRQQATLREQAELLDHAHVMIRDLDNRITYWNSGAEQLYGWSKAEALGQITHTFFQTRFPESLEAYQEQLFDQGVWEGELVHTRHDGTDVYVASHQVLHRDSFGAPLAILEVNNDITERKRAEQALRQSEERFAKAFWASPAAILISRANDRRFIDINESMQQLLGYSRDELIEHTAQELNIFPNTDEIAMIGRLLREVSKLHNYEITIQTKSGELRQALFSTEAIEVGEEACFLTILYDITERKQAEQALRYQADLLAQVSDAIISTDLSFTIKTWNGAAEALYGWPAQEAIGKRMIDLVPTNYLDIERQQVVALLFKEERWHGEVVQQRRDGTQLPMLISVSLLKDSSGNPIGAVAVNRDITERKQAELALQRSAERLRVLADASRAFAEAGAEYQTLLERIARTTTAALGEGCIVGLISDDQEWMQPALLHDVNPERRERLPLILGNTPLRMNERAAITRIAQTNQSLLLPIVDPEQLKAATQPAYHALIDHQGIHSLLGVPMRVQGRPIGALMLYRCRPEQPSFDESDLMLAQDLADRAALAIENARLLAQVQRAANRLEHLHALDQAILAGRPLADIAESAVAHIGQLISTTRVGVLLIDADQQRLAALALLVHGSLQTPPAQMPLAIFGEALETLAQGHTYQVADVAALPEPPAFIRISQATQVRAYFQVPIMAGDALIALLNVGADTPNAFTPEHIEIAYEVANQLSIAIQQARLREQIARHAQELEQRVEARTAQLEAANKELEAFSYSVSHDLRAPLRAIDGFSRILLEEYVASLPEDAQEYFNLIRSNTQQMGRLVDDLLAFSRLSRQPLAKRPVDTIALIRQCLQELSNEQAGRQITIEVGELPECWGDAALLKQVWLNLLANALKYTRRRDPATIEIGSQEAGEETVYFVKDNGVGFDMRYANKLFGVFQRMHRAEEYEGTGVGLAIVQRIVQRHGGRVWADAAIDQGTTFYFTLEGSVR